MIAKPPLDDWKVWVEMLSTGQPNLSLVASMTGYDKATLVKAWKTGWPGHKKTGRGALPPIKHVVQQMNVAAVSQRSALEARLNEEQRQAIALAIKEGAAKKALEGMVSDTFLRAIEQNMLNALKLINASQPLVNLLVSQMQTMAASKEVTMAEARAAISFVTGFLRESSSVLASYFDLEQTRAKLGAPKADLLTEETKSPDKLVEELANLLHGIKAITSAKPVVIDVTATASGQSQPPPSPGSSQSSSSTPSAGSSSASSSSGSSQSSSSSSASSSSGSSQSSMPRSQVSGSEESGSDHEGRLALPGMPTGSSSSPTDSSSHSIHASSSSLSPPSSSSSSSPSSSSSSGTR